METEAYQRLVNKLDEVHAELVRLQDPVKELKNQWLDTQQVMEVLRISRRTLTKMLNQGKLSCSKIENKNYFLLADIEKFLANNHRTRKRIERQINNEAG